MHLPPFEPPAKVTLSDAIAAHIETQIAEGALRPGETLPSERELSQRLSVSRPSLREALLKLEAKGLLQGRRGGSMRVVDVFTPALADPLVELLKRHRGAVADVLELRQALEEVAAYYAALRATDADRAEIARRLARLQALHRGDDAAAAAQADVDFHMAIAESSHNLPLVCVMRSLFDLLRSNVTQARERLLAAPDNYEVLQEHHETIGRAVLARDAEGARAAVHRHLSFVDATLASQDGRTPRQKADLALQP